MVDETQANQEATFFDPETFVTTSKLNGRRGLITEAVFVRHNYGGKISEEATAARLTVVCDALPKPVVNLYGCGNLFPSEDRRTKAPSGPYLIGGQVTKGSNLDPLMRAIQTSGFPREKLKAEGLYALDGAEFDWIAFEKRAGKEVKTYDMPAKFIGFAGGEAPVAAPDDSEIKMLVATALRAALEEQAEIPRGQLVVKVGPKLGPVGNKTAALGLLLKNDFLAQVEGIVFDAKVVRKA